MGASAESRIARWSTADVDLSQRFDYYSDALSTALTPMQVRACDHTPSAFTAETRSATLGSIDVLHQIGDASQAYRGPAEIARSQGHSYHLIINLTAPWGVTHRGSIKLDPGEAVFTDSNYGHHLVLSHYSIINLRFEEQWIRAWLPLPNILTGRKIAATSNWARALISFVRQLSPEFVVEAPLPSAVIADQIGALLALVAHDMSGGHTAPTRVNRAMSERIEDTTIQRCSEAGLTAEGIAKSLNISTRTLHRCLAACGKTFGALMQKSRVEVAARMLESPLFKRLTVAEIGRRAGFSEASHFSRAFKQRTGYSPAELRRGS